MARVSDADQKLVETALKMAQKSGWGALKLRDVAQKAGVNLGMFHYHFKTKDAFIRRVLQEAYERFFKELSLGTEKGGPAQERLRAAVLTLGRFARENRRLLFGILHGILEKDKGVVDFVKANVPRHAKVIVGLVGECQKEGSMGRYPLSVVMPLLLGAVGAPNLVLVLLEHLEIKTVKFIPDVLLEKAFLSDRLMEQRADLALAALAPRKGGKA